MATFGKSTFNAVSYAASRPTYPHALFDYVFRFHSASGVAARWDTAVDLGCGTGQATIELTPFKRILGTDPSAGMVDAARRTLASFDSAVQAERLTFLSEGSVDLMIAAQAGHWFDWSRMWPEVARVVRKDGTVAVWNYSELRLPKYPALTPQLSHFFQGTDPLTSIGPYWQQPGRSILDGHLVAIPDARDVVPGAFKDFTRCYFTGAYHPNLPSPQPILMRKRMTWHDLYGYFCTASALHTFFEQHPEDKVRSDGNIGMRLWKSLLSGASAQDWQLYDFIFDFHKRSPDAKFERAVDLGCGTGKKCSREKRIDTHRQSPVSLGQATVELKLFKYITGVDLSENMIHSAREVFGNRRDVDSEGDQPGPVINFVQGSAEKLNFLSDAAQAGHWFDWSIMWPELARIMRKGATAAFWIYSEFRLPQYPTLTPLIVDYDQGTDPNNSIGPYWQQPGRSVLINHLVGIPEGNDVVPGAFEPLDRVYFTGAYYPELPSARSVVLRKVMSWEDLLGYFHTWSALHTFKERNPSDAVHPDGPVEVRFLKALQEGAAQVGGLPNEVEVEWPVAMVLGSQGDLRMFFPIGTVLQPISIHVYNLQRRQLFE
ncbi:hypothetical protein J3R83DRAFT_3313 [Lanmaoa asiatica]|nr:hypothetical protein J3R83DRAFT_3313 [Lanmaoa asiatica]